ncbi:hypothetical protein FHS27_004065 [Rhodopirellula rubra]|uniref:Uncharacterized protein n=1 Tax=Aporhodopirellula rubra TaxID=980271 RepID=A0A7W5H7D0_9BACT|nr:hypothetical protein [Aporhodopirellula rubra]
MKRKNKNANNPPTSAADFVNFNTDVVQAASLQRPTQMTHFLVSLQAGSLHYG